MQITIHNPMTLNRDAVERLDALCRQSEPPDLVDVRTFDDHTVEAVATFSARGALCAARADNVADAVGLAANERDPTARTLVYYRRSPIAGGVYAWTRNPYDPTYVINAFASSPVGFDVQIGPRDVLQVRIAEPGEHWQTIETSCPMRAASEAVMLWRQRQAHAAGAVTIRARSTVEPRGAVATAAPGAPDGLPVDVLRYVLHNRSQSVCVTVAGDHVEMRGTRANGVPVFYAWSGVEAVDTVRPYLDEAPAYGMRGLNEAGAARGRTIAGLNMAERVERMRAAAGVEYVEIGGYGSDGWAAIARKGNRYAMAEGSTPTHAACDAIHLVTSADLI